MMRSVLFRAIFLLTGILPATADTAAAERLDYQVLDKADHDPGIFTQGFALDDGWFYESSGHYGRSFLIRYSRDDSADYRRRALPSRVFAEGIELVGDRLYLLSWKAGKAWAMDRENFQVLQEYRYPGEGWGLTHDGERLILSDGTDTLRFYSENFEPLGSRKVRLEGKPLRRLNELEYHEGLVWANQWQSDTIYGINPESGRVEAVVNLAKLRGESSHGSREGVLNGIAHDGDRDGFWITGKYWRHRYLLRFRLRPAVKRTSEPD